MSPKRKGLGRGLDALLSPEEPNTLASTAVQQLPVENLEPNRFQPRSAFDESGLDELAQSISAQGIVQPIIVTPKDSSHYKIIAGERRWRAAQKIGLKQVPVVIREVEDDRQMLELALVENVQRADLNAIEEAEAYKVLSERFQLSQGEIAKKVGKARTTVTNALRLLRLPAEIQDYLREGRLTAGQARPLLSLSKKEEQISIAEKAVSRGMTARDLEMLVADNKPKSKNKSALKDEKDVHTRAAIDQLTRSLQTKVDIVRSKKGGKIQIYFSSEDELIRLHETLVRG